MSVLNRCQSKRKMAVEETELPSEESPAPTRSPEKSESVEFVADFYTQALKALSERSPFDSTEVLAKTSVTLPSELASLFSKHSESRKKHKRHHSDNKSSKKSSKKSKYSKLWVELEGYFRELKLEDIARLYRFSSSFSLLASSNSCLVIPASSNVVMNHDFINDEVENLHGGDAMSAGEVVLVDNVVNNKENNKENGYAEIDGNLDSRAVEIDAEIQTESREDVSVAEQQGSVLDSVQSCSSGLEWVLGCRNRVLLTTIRPSKKRKLLGENAGLEKLMVAQPYEGSSRLCHVCSMRDTGDQLNQLVVCWSCKVVVHQKCYGVQGKVDESWTCSWCKYKTDGLSSDRPCVLCPKSGGACKRFERAGGEDSVEFAHLFCCLWMPEVHIGNTRLMEPRLCVGVNEVREKLVCNLCKIKHGFCVRCSYGSCRTSFHPICGREASNKLEIWGKFGCDDIELRAFCSKHSGNSSVTGSGTGEQSEVGGGVGSGSLDNLIQQGNKIKKLKIGFKNGDKVTLSIGEAEFNTKSSEDNVTREPMQKDIMSNMELKSVSGDIQEFSQVDAPGHKLFQDVASSPNLDVVLKKLLDCGKVTLEQIASEIGISEDSLASKLTGNHFGPELSCEILKWLRDHAYIHKSEKDFRAKVRLMLPPKAELASHYHSDAVALMDMDMPDVVPVKSVPPRRRTIGNIVKDDKVIPLWDDKFLGNEELLNELKEQKLVNGDHDLSNKDSVSDGPEKMMGESNGFEHSLEEVSEMINPSIDEHNGAEEVTCQGRSSLLDLDQEPPCSINAVDHCNGDLKLGADSFVHPFIQKKLEEVQCLLVRKAPPECDLTLDFPGGTKFDSSAVDQSSAPNMFSGDNVDEGEQSHGVKIGDLHTAKNTSVLDLSPENELEGEIIFCQQRLLQNTVALKYCADELVCKVVRSLPNEMDAVREQRWDGVLVNQYIYELKEARKQGRKERRHKEAQAVLAAATAAVAASSRVSSLRKDIVDDSSQLEDPLKRESSRNNGVLSSLSVSRPIEYNTSFDVPKVISDGYSNKEQFKSCDICGRMESLLNPILVCLSCKVAVHLNCYRSVKESTGPWFCELCEESSLSKASRSTLEKPYPLAECGLCGASNGAFRKSTDGQWIHAFCAEWVFDSTFRRGQVSPVTGMETVLKENDICSVCHRRFGVCIKCNNGNCQATFHPSCARSAGYYMCTKYEGGGKMQHKAYCCKHSLEQKTKAETQKHDAEDMKVVKQHRVELEKLRLLCERIVKREKLKRELVLCNYDILASRRDSLAVSVLSRRPFMEYDGSSESATTSLRGHSRSCSEAMQKSDDITADSALSSKRCIRFPLNIYIDRKADDSSASPRISTPKPTERVLFAGKQIPVRATLTSGKFSDSGEKLKCIKNTETFEKELVMTSDQASLRNRRLPKGYFYVPLDSLSNEKLAGHDSTEQEEVDE
ncbi:hypothetical protein RND81_06G052700 [Saponaria officinalis]|uniref:Uncharacterized protein n=1 Tax=Saponaria officinalis TaxID=3572 RepID=A0AAW1K7Z3_SAPOF